MSDNSAYDGEPTATGRLRYLSLEWIAALSAEVAASESMGEIAQHHTVGVTQIISGGPEGDVRLSPARCPKVTHPLVPGSRS